MQSDLALPARFAEIMGNEELALAGGVLASATPILRLSGTPFFPDYTDHGLAHVQSTLDSTEDLITDAVWDANTFSGRDAAVLTVSVVLHDFAMHIQEASFLELIDPSWPQRPFAGPIGSKADPPWHVLWASFQREARHFTGTQLENLLGASHEGVPDLAYDASGHEPAQWTRADRLLVGEFLRRHHARIAHEAAVLGLPGARDHFAGLQNDVETAEIVGLVARSHGMPIRTAFSALDVAYESTLLPAGVHAHYLMALIRIADFVQLGATRAPPLLLQLKQPVSRTTLEEWSNTGAVARITSQHRDDAAIYVETKPGHGLRTHFAIRELLDTFQAELDTTGAALREAYGSQEPALRIAKQRVVSNLDSPSLLASLPYVPVRARLHSSDDLFRLIVSDLYGNEPVVGGRELLQNAVDAVREREALQPSYSSYEREPQVLVAVREIDADVCEMEVNDSGVGMKAEVVTDYFMTAGASFAPSQERHAGSIGALKTGRFGVGAFAGFVLGFEMEVVTRHVDDERGLKFTLSLGADLVEITRCDAPVGTRVIVRFRPTKLRWPAEPFSAFINEVLRYFVLDAPTVNVNISAGDRETSRVNAQGFVPTSESGENERWRRFTCKDVEAVQWSWEPLQVNLKRLQGAGGGTLTNLAHNGFEVRPPSNRLGEHEFGYRWQWGPITAVVEEPYVAITDPHHKLGLTLTRYALGEQLLPFERDLAISVGEDVVARGLARGEGRHPAAKGLALSPVVIDAGWFPLTPRLLGEYVGSEEIVWLLMADSDRLNDSFLEADALAPKDLRVIRAIGNDGRLSSGEGMMKTWKDAWREVGRAELRPHFRSAGFSGEAKAEDVRVSWTNPATGELWGDWLAHLLSEMVRAGLSFSLMAYERREDGDWRTEVQEPISETWEEVVGGLMPRADALRADLGREVAIGRPDVVRYADSWLPT
jgi:molecular chaperone HtpG